MSDLPSPQAKALRRLIPIKDVERVKNTINRATDVFYYEPKQALDIIQQALLAFLTKAGYGDVAQVYDEALKDIQDNNTDAYKE